MSLNQKGVRANNEIIQRYMPLVKSIAKKLASRLPKHYDIEDLISDGVVGLLAATERFDPNRGVKFETFATYYIKGSILDNLPKIPVIKSYTQKKSDDEENLHEDKEEIEEYSQSQEDENIDEASLLYNKITQMTYNYILSLDAPSGSDSDDNYNLLNQVGKNDSIQNEIEFEELQNMLRLAIEQLPVQERTTLKYYYFHKMPFNEIGKKLGLSESWVSRIHKRALEQLRNKIGKKKSVDDFISPY
ncbi:MAG: FliA/WhiG family RNA polymerase sigma factor [Candidatus Sericytochromatia bacterium]|nr:MAG: FliA/WhiG family RNA polymerase sigma factor [Candidatus Sericytochromatia bacterium]